MTKPVGTKMFKDIEEQKTAAIEKKISIKSEGVIIPEKSSITQKVQSTLISKPQINPKLIPKPITSIKKNETKSKKTG